MQVKNKAVHCTVCALVVTYNRSEYLNVLLDGLFGQTHRLDKLVIFDNCSTDDTQSLLSLRGLIAFPLADGGRSVLLHGGIEVHCIRNAVNSGGSGGFHDGLDYALKLGCSYVWAMDDDVVPDTDCLLKLISQMTDGRRICIPNRTGNGFVDNAITEVNMSNPFRYSVGMRKTAISADDLSDEVTLVKDMPFEGPLIDVSLIKEIGLPNSELFIIFDDTEYCHRALKKTTVGFVRSAHLRKQIVPKAEHGRLMGWKDYYGYRNQYWFDATYGCNVFVQKIRPVLSVCDLILRAIMRRKWSNIRVLKRAYADGTSGLLGKRVNPGESM